MALHLNLLSPTGRRRVFWLLLAATLTLMVILNLVAAPLVTPEAPYGIVSYELAGSVDQAEQILGSWDMEARLRSAFSLGLDYLFMVAYALTIAWGCLWSAEKLLLNGWPFARLGVFLAAGQFLAALLDALENVALAVMLFSQVTAPWPQVANWSATIKFGLVFAGLVYTFFGLVAHLSVRGKLDV
jgi:hypothetical protein